MKLGVTEGEAFVLLRDLRLWYYEVEEEILISKYFKPKYRFAGVGGTFDNLHIGHLALLNVAFRLAEKVYVGCVSDELLKKLDKKGQIATFEERKKLLEDTIRKYGWSDKAEIGILDDPYGPMITRSDFDLLVVSPFTYSRAIEINELRIKKGLSPVSIETCPVVLAEDGKPISSTRVRMGEVHPDGRIKRIQI